MVGGIFGIWLFGDEGEGFSNLTATVILLAVCGKKYERNVFE